MKLGIVVVYLFDANTEYLLDLHISYIRKFTTSPYEIYGSAGRLAPQWRQKLSKYPEIQLCEISPTELREGEEHAFYLERLTEIAFQKGSTHVVTLHLDSFPVRVGWEKILKAITDQSGTCVAAEAFYTACLFFTKEFYFRYRPAFRCVEKQPQYLEFVEKYKLIDHSGTPYLYVCSANHLNWHVLKNISRKPMTHFGSLCGGLIFHLVAAIRLSPAGGLVEEKPLRKTRVMGLISIQFLRKLPFLRMVWSWGCKHLPKKVSYLLKSWLTHQAFWGEVAEKEFFRLKLMKNQKFDLFEVKDSMDLSAILSKKEIQRFRDDFDGEWPK